MVKKTGNVFVPSGSLKTVKISGHTFKYKEIDAQTRNEIVEKHTKVDRLTGTGTQDTTKILQELMAATFVEVPEKLKTEFEKEHGKKWKGTAEDFGKLYPHIQDKMSKYVGRYSGLSEEEKDF
jgi:hypothetical protein